MDLGWLTKKAYVTQKRLSLLYLSKMLNKNWHMNKMSMYQWINIKQGAEDSVWTPGTMRLGKLTRLMVSDHKKMRYWVTSEESKEILMFTTSFPAAKMIWQSLSLKMTISMPAWQSTRISIRMSLMNLNTWGRDLPKIQISCTRHPQAIVITLQCQSSSK